MLILDEKTKLCGLDGEGEQAFSAEVCRNVDVDKGKEYAESHIHLPGGDDITRHGILRTDQAAEVESYSIGFDEAAYAPCQF